MLPQPPDKHLSEKKSTRKSKYEKGINRSANEERKGGSAPHNKYGQERKMLVEKEISKRYPDNVN